MTRLLSPLATQAWTFDFPENTARPVKATLRCRDDLSRDDADAWGLVTRRSFSYEAAWEKIEELRNDGWKCG